MHIYTSHETPAQVVSFRKNDGNWTAVVKTTCGDTYKITPEFYRPPAKSDVEPLQITLKKGDTVQITALSINDQKEGRSRAFWMQLHEYEAQVEAETSWIIQTAIYLCGINVFTKKRYARERSEMELHTKNLPEIWNKWGLRIARTLLAQVPSGSWFNRFEPIEWPHQEFRSATS